MAIGFVELLLAVFTALTAYVFWSMDGLRRRKNLPPGPRGLPIVGNLPYVGKTPYTYFRDLSIKYGSGVVSVRLGSKDVVVLNDWKSFQEAMLKQSDLFSGRPKLALWDASLKNEDIITTNGRLWKERKRFTLHHLRDMGVGKQSMEEVIMDEVKKTINFVDEQSAESSSTEVTHLFFAPIFSTLGKIVAGNTYDVDDTALRNLSDAIRFNFRFFRNNNPMNFMPYLRYVPDLTDFREFLASHTKVEDLIKVAIDEHERTYVESDTRDFIDMYLKEIHKNKDKSRSESPFQKEGLLGTIYNLYNAGVETTEHTLSFALLYMALWPEIQSKVQAELDQLIGRGRFPTYADRKLLPYTDATIQELLRYSTVVPLSVPHSPTATTIVSGYVIPKDTFVMPNIWAVHNDAALWGDPEVFRPERFLDEHGNVQKPDYLVPFGIGARFCLGEALARMELFLFFACLMQRFTFRCITGETPPSLEPIIGVTQRPQPFSLVVKQRE